MRISALQVYFLSETAPKKTVLGIGKAFKKELVPASAEGDIANLLTSPKTDVKRTFLIP